MDSEIRPGAHRSIEPREVGLGIGAGADPPLPAGNPRPDILRPQTHSEDRARGWPTKRVDLMACRLCGPDEGKAQHGVAQVVEFDDEQAHRG